MKKLKQKNIRKFGVKAANFSGITRIEGNRYAVVDDKETTDGFMFLDIDIDTKNGKVRDVSYAEPSGFIDRKSNIESIDRDCEGIAYCKQSNTLFVTGEKDQRIMEYDLNGNPTGRELDIPDFMSVQNIVGNYGFEALSYNEQEETFWTTTEATLKSDGQKSSLKNRDVQNRLRILSFGSDLKPAMMFAYQMDRMEAKAKKGNHVHGVPAMLALNDGRLIVMEREACVRRNYIDSFCRIKLYEVRPEADKALPYSVVLSELTDNQFLGKRLLYKFTTHVSFVWNFANYEGMCLGPKLDDGRQTLVLICDSQGGRGNSFYRLKDYIKVLILSNDYKASINL